MAIMLLLNGVWTDTASKRNNVSASASTGGDGQATSQVEIKTVINGEIVEDINETVSSPAGESSSIKRVRKLSCLHLAPEQSLAQEQRQRGFLKLALRQERIITRLRLAPKSLP